MNKNKLTASGIIFFISLAMLAGVYRMSFQKFSNALAERKSVYEKFQNIDTDLGNFPAMLQSAMEQKQKFQDLLSQFEGDYIPNQDISAGFKARVLQTAKNNKIVFTKDELSKDGAGVAVLTVEFETSYENFYKFVFDLEMFSEVKSVSVSADGSIKVAAAPITYPSNIDDYFSGRSRTMTEADTFGYFKDVFDRTANTFKSIGHIPSRRDLLPAPARDPFYFLHAKQAPVKAAVKRGPVKRSFPKIEIEGIMYDPANPLVVIGEKIYRVGSVIKGAKITRVTERDVTFTFDGQKYTIRIVRED